VDRSRSTEPKIPVLDEKLERSLSYALPPKEQVSMALLTNHLASREAELPLRRRTANWLMAGSGRS
jgi:hypothetical protein